MNSLWARVLAGTTLAVAAVLAFAGWSLHGLMERSLLAEVDGALADRARLLASAVELEGTHLDVEFEDFDMSEFEGHGEEHGHDEAPQFDSPAVRAGFLQLTTEDGDVVYRSASLGEHVLVPEPAAGDLSVSALTLPSGQRGRAVTLRYTPHAEHVPSPAAGPRITLVLARDTVQVDEAMATLSGLLLLVGGVTLLAAGGVLTLVVRRTLQPVGGVAASIASIGEHSLSTRLDVAGVPSELLPVVVRVNELLARLEAAFDRERSFSSDVAHELRTPLAGLRATLEVTASRPRSDQDLAAALRDGTALTVQLQSVVERLFQLARLDAGRELAAVGPYELADACVDAWEPFARTAVARGLDVQWDLADGLDVTLDGDLVHLILRNLYENAVTYSDQDGCVRIATFCEAAGALTLTVGNSGSRISQADAQAATQRFWRGDAARTDAGLHCGLGLALVERACAALGGRLTLRSDVGGDFVVSLTIPGAVRSSPPSALPATGVTPARRSA